VTIDGEGGVSAAGTKVSIVLPSGWAVDSVMPTQGSCDATTNPITCSLGRIGGLGTSAAITITGHPTRTGQLNASASVTFKAADPTPVDDSTAFSTTVVPPQPGQPTYHLVIPSTLAAPTPLHLPEQTTWAASNPNDYVCSYQVQQSVDGGTYKTLSKSAPDATSVTTDVSLGHSYSYQVRAADCQGDKSAWSIGPSFQVAGAQETAASYIGQWAVQNITGAWGGMVATTTQVGGAVTYHFTGRNVAWIGTVGPTYGSADVYVDGKYRATVDCHAATQSTKQVLFRYGWPDSGAHTIKIVTDGTAGHPRVDVDGFVTFA
jgi:hypothetical protein